MFYEIFFYFLHRKANEKLDEPCLFQRVSDTHYSRGDTGNSAADSPVSSLIGRTSLSCRWPS